MARGGRGIRRRRLPQYRRRLLRHHPGAHRGDRRGGGQVPAAGHPGDSPGLSPVRPGAVHHRPRSSLFVNVGERTSITSSAKFARLIREENYAEALGVAQRQVEAGAQVIDINMDEGMLDSKAAMVTFLNLIASGPDISRVPTADRLLQVGSDRGRPEVHPGQGHRQLDLDEGRRRGLQAPCPPVQALRRRGGGDGLRRGRPGRHRRRARKKSASAPTTSWSTKSASHRKTSSSMRTSSPSPPASRNTTTTRVDFINACAYIRDHLPYALSSGRVSNVSFSFRGSNPVREAIHSVFLYYAIRNGLTMGIVNAGQLEIYDEIPGAARPGRDVVLNRHARGHRRPLLAIRRRLQGQRRGQEAEDEEWRSYSVEKRLEHAAGQGHHHPGSSRTPRNAASSVRVPSRSSKVR